MIPCPTCGHIPPPPVVTYGPIVHDGSLRQASVNGDPLTLTRKEFNILGLLIQRVGTVITIKEIFSTCWGDTTRGYESQPASSHTIKSHISSLRRELSAAGFKIEITNIPAIGYRLEALT